MREITIPDLPEEVFAELAARADAQGVRIEDYVRARLFDLARSPDPEVFAARLRERKARSRSRLGATDILEHRDADRR